MPENLNRLQSLVDLARETSEERRRQLLQEVTDLFFAAGSSITDANRDLFGGVMTKVLPDVEAQVRKDLAGRLARVAEAPPDVIRWLANDEIDIARPVLTESTVLGDADLIAIVDRHGTDHMVAISQRATVSTAVSDRLVEKGDDRVVETLVRNQGAQLSRQAFDNVARRAETNQALQAPLVERRDAPPDVLHGMYWTVSSKLREKILAATAAIKPAELDRILAESEAAVAAELKARGAKAADEAEQYIAAQEAHGKLNTALLVQLLRQDKFAYFVAGMARLARMDVPTVRHILSDRNGEAAAIACKAMGLHWAHFSNLMLMVDREHRRSPTDLQQLLTLYNQLASETAQRAMRFWRVRRKGGTAQASGS
jgi:uncharacterized protein (DUF2336 family)